MADGDASEKTTIAFQWKALIPLAVGVLVEAAVWTQMEGVPRWLLNSSIVLGVLLILSFNVATKQKWFRRSQWIVGSAYTAVILYVLVYSKEFQDWIWNVLILGVASVPWPLIIVGSFALLGAGFGVGFWYFIHFRRRPYDEARHTKDLEEAEARYMKMTEATRHENVILKARLSIEEDNLKDIDDGIFQNIRNKYMPLPWEQRFALITILNHQTRMAPDILKTFLESIGFGDPQHRIIEPLSCVESLVKMRDGELCIESSEVARILKKVEKERPVPQVLVQEVIRFEKNASTTVPANAAELVWNWRKMIAEVQHDPKPLAALVRHHDYLSLRPHLSDGVRQRIELQSDMLEGFLMAVPPIPRVHPIIFEVLETIDCVASNWGLPTEPLAASKAIRTPSAVESAMRVSERPTSLKLQFNAVNTIPIEIGKQNIWRWYALRNIVSAIDKNGNTVDVVSLFVFLTFERPITFEQIRIDSGGAILPRHEVKDSSQRTMIVAFAGEMTGVIVQIYAV